MKYVIYCILLFISALLFLPEAESSEIRNPELLLTVIALILLFFAIKFIKLSLSVNRIKKALIVNKIRIKSTRFGIGKAYIIAENSRETLDVCLLMRKKSYYKYHFTDENHIEFYKTTVTAVKNGRDRVTVSQASPEVKHVGDQRIRRQPAERGTVKYYLVMDKFPNKITAASGNHSLGNGDRIGNSEVVLYDIKGFAAAISE